MIINAVENATKFEEIINNSGFLGQKIYADYISGQLKETNSFYVTENCAFMLSGINVTLCGNPTDDELEEILVFCNFYGIKTIESQIPDLHANLERTLHIMEFKGEIRSCTETVTVNEDNYSFIKFCCENFHGLVFDIVYSNFVRKINRGIADIYYIVKNGRIAAGAIATKYSEDTVYITFVSTSPDYRNQGLAAQVLSYIINSNKGRKVILKCEDELKAFYEKLGFKATGTVNLYKDR